MIRKGLNVDDLYTCNNFPRVLLFRRAVNAAGTDFELDMKYEMIKPIGHGAYGVVISALDHESNSKVNRLRGLHF